MVYVAENVTPQVSVGQQVNANTVFGTPRLVTPGSPPGVNNGHVVGGALPVWWPQF